MTDIFIFRELVKVILFILLCQIWSKNSSPVNQGVKLHTCNYDCAKLHTHNHLIKVRINVKLTYKVHIYFLKNSKRGNIKQNFKYTRISMFNRESQQVMTYRINSKWIRTRGIVKVICWIHSPASLFLQCAEAANQM